MSVRRALEDVKQISDRFMNGMRTTFLSPATRTGLDIGSRAIKLVRLRALRKGWGLDSIQVKHVPEPKEGEQERNRERIIGDTLAQLVEEGQIQGARTAISISGPSVMVKPIEVPLMTKEELKGHLELELERYLSYERHDIYWDYYAPHVRCERQPSLMNVYLVAAKKDTVDRRVKLVTDAGLRPVVVDIDGFALANMYGFNYQQRTREATLLVNVSPTGLTMTVLGVTGRLYMHDVAIGGEWRQNVLHEAALLASENLELRESLVSRSPVADGLLEDVYEEIATEVRRTIESFNSDEGEQRIHQVLLCGGYAHLPGLAGLLNMQLDMLVEVADSFKRLTVSRESGDSTKLKTLSILAGVAVGLALRCGRDQ